MDCARLVTLAIAGTVMVATVALADEKWKTVTLDGNPDFTVSIPAAVDDYSPGKTEGALMFFSVTAGGHGGLTCMAWRTAYPKEAPHDKFAPGLATNMRDNFCQGNGGTISGVEIGGSTSFVHYGSQAAECTASFTDSKEKLPGRVDSQMVVASSAHAYFLTCMTEDEDQDTAEFEWARFWEEIVRHIQKSFHTPK
jgi:hypothetical protein